MSQLDPNPYDGDEYLNVVLCDVKWENDNPSPDYGTVLHALPPNGPVHITKEVAMKEKDIKGKNKKKNASASRIELKGFKSGEVSFPLELNTDDPDEDDPKTALKKFEEFNDAFMSLDDAGRNTLFTIDYPSVNAAKIEMVFFKSFEMQETQAGDLLTVNVVMKEVFGSQISRKGSGDSASSGSGKTDREKMEDEGRGGEDDEGDTPFGEGFDKGVQDILFHKSGLGDNE